MANLNSERFKTRRAMSKSSMRRLRWMGTGGGVVLFLGILIATGDEGAGIIIGLAGLAILLSVGYVAYDLGRSERRQAPDGS